MAGAQEINVDAATAAVLSELDGTLTLKEEHKNDTESFSQYKTFPLYFQLSLERV